MCPLVFPPAGPHYLFRAVTNPLCRPLLQDRKERSDMSLKEKTVIITGGGTGIGADAAHSFRAAGAKVILNGRREDVLSKTAQSIDPTGEHVAYVVGDIGRPETVQRLVQT